TPAGDVYDVTGAFMSITKRLPKGGEMNAKVSVLYRHVRPDAGCQLPFTDDFSGLLNQGNEKIQCATTELNRFATLLEESLRRREAKRTKRNGVTHFRTIAIIHGPIHLKACILEQISPVPECT